MQRLAAIIFDVDGTLAETEEVHRLAFNYTFSEFGLDWEWTPALYEDLLAISGGRRRIAQFGHALRTRFKNDVEFEEFVTTVHKAKTRKYAAMIQEGEVPLRPGVRRLIDEARAQNLTLAMATSSAQSNLEALLDMNLPAGWRDWFAAIETCENVGEQKPASAVYKAVLQTLGIECSSAVAIEDTVNGLLAATGAGLATVITTHRYTQARDFPNASLVIDSMGEPDEPFNVAYGDTHEATFLDTKLLDTLLVKRNTPSSSAAA